MFGGSTSEHAPNNEFLLFPPRICHSREGGNPVFKPLFSMTGLRVKPAMTEKIVNFWRFNLRKFYKRKNPRFVVCLLTPRGAHVVITSNY